MNHEQELNELTLQRCVDGELDEPQQQALLCQLEQHPTGWRSLALAFLEHQLWSQAGREWMNRPAAPPPLIAPRKVTFPSWIRNTALAASTLLAVGVGYLGGSRDFREHGLPSGGDSHVVSDTSDSADANIPTVNVSTTDGHFTLRPEDDPLVPVMHVEVLPEDGGPPIRMPVYDSAVMHRTQPPLAPQLPAETRRKLEELGIQVSEEPGYYTVPDEQGRHLVMPVNSIQLRPRLQ